MFKDVCPGNLTLVSRCFVTRFVPPFDLNFAPFFPLTRVDLFRRLQQRIDFSLGPDAREDSCAFRRFDRSRRGHINVIVTHVNTRGIATRGSRNLSTQSVKYRRYEVSTFRNCSRTDRSSCPSESMLPAQRARPVHPMDPDRAFTTWSACRVISNAKRDIGSRNFV